MYRGRSPDVVFWNTHITRHHLPTWPRGTDMRLNLTGSLDLGIVECFGRIRGGMGFFCTRRLNLRRAVFRFKAGGLGDISPRGAPRGSWRQGWWDE